jgi:predicted Zn-dependent protease
VAGIDLWPYTTSIKACQNRQQASATSALQPLRKHPPDNVTFRAQQCYRHCRLVC